MKNTILEITSKLLEEIEASRYYKIDEYEDEEEIEETEFKELLSSNQKCGFEFYLEVDYSVPIDFDSTEKKCDSSGFYQDCYSFPFSETATKLFDELGYGKEFFNDWVKQHYGKPEYEQVWDGETLYDKDYLVAGNKENYQSVWKVLDYLKIEFFND